MRAKITDKKSFIPIKLELTLESSEEAGLLFCIMNHSAIADAVKKHFDVDAIIRELNSVRDKSPFEYADYFEKFCKDLGEHSCMKEHYQKK